MFGHSCVCTVLRISRCDGVGALLTFDAHTFTIDSTTATELEDNLLRGAAPLLSSAPPSQQQEEQQPQEEEQEQEQEQPLTDEPSEPEAQQPQPPLQPPQPQQQEPAQETKEKEVVEEGAEREPTAASDDEQPQQEQWWRLGKGRLLPSWPLFPSFSTAAHWPWLCRPPSTHTESTTTTDSGSSSSNSSSGNGTPKEPSPTTTSPWHRWLTTATAAGASALGRVQWREWPPALAVLAAVIVADVTARLPGCPRGYMGMGGRLVDGGVYWACTGGIHRLVDLSVLGAAHTAAAGDEPAASLYWTEPFDRYGVVNALVLAAVVALVAATVGGRACLRAHAAPQEEEEGQGADGGSKTIVAADRNARFPRARPSVAALWAALGAGLVALSFILEHAAGIPPVPALLTPSFLGWALGTGLLALAALYFLMGTPPLSVLLLRRRGRCCWKDRQRQEEEGAQEQEQEQEQEPEPWTAPALVALGRNPLLVYAGHCLLRRRFPFGMDVASTSSSAGGGTVVEGLAAGCLGVASWAAVAWALERRGIVFRA